jgi:hypothetical protein
MRVADKQGERANIPDQCAESLAKRLRAVTRLNVALLAHAGAKRRGICSAAARRGGTERGNAAGIARLVRGRRCRFGPCLGHTSAKRPDLFEFQQGRHGVVGEEERERPCLCRAMQSHRHGPFRKLAARWDFGATRLPALVVRG